MAEEKFCSECGNPKKCCCEKCKQACSKCEPKCAKTEHCWHYQKQDDATMRDVYENALQYQNGGPNRRCCYCGKYESDMHGKFAPTYLPYVQSATTWTINPTTTNTTAKAWNCYDVQNLNIGFYSGSKP
jgi:hypothetical protein